MARFRSFVRGPFLCCCLALVLFFSCWTIEYSFAGKYQSTQSTSKLTKAKTRDEERLCKRGTVLTKPKSSQKKSDARTSNSLAVSTISNRTLIDLMDGFRITPVVPRVIRELRVVLQSTSNRRSSSFISPQSIRLYNYCVELVQTFPDVKWAASYFLDIIRQSGMVVFPFRLLHRIAVCIIISFIALDQPPELIANTMEEMEQGGLQFESYKVQLLDLLLSLMNSDCPDIRKQYSKIDHGCIVVLLEQSGISRFGDYKNITRSETGPIVEAKNSSNTRSTELSLASSISSSWSVSVNNFWQTHPSNFGAHFGSDNLTDPLEYYNYLLENELSTLVALDFPFPRNGVNYPARSAVLDRFLTLSRFVNESNGAVVFLAMSLLDRLLALPSNKTKDLCGTDLLLVGMTSFIIAIKFSGPSASNLLNRLSHIIPDLMFYTKAIWHSTEIAVLSALDFRLVQSNPVEYLDTYYLLNPNDHTPRELVLYLMIIFLFEPKTASMRPSLLFATCLVAAKLISKGSHVIQRTEYLRQIEYSLSNPAEQKAMFLLIRSIQKFGSPGTYDGIFGLFKPLNTDDILRWAGQVFQSQAFKTLILDVLPILGPPREMIVKIKKWQWKSSARKSSIKLPKLIEIEPRSLVEDFLGKASANSSVALLCLQIARDRSAIFWVADYLYHLLGNHFAAAEMSPSATISLVGHFVLIARTLLYRSTSDIASLIMIRFGLDRDFVFNSYMNLFTVQRLLEDPPAELFDRYASADYQYASFVVHSMYLKFAMPLQVQELRRGIQDWSAFDVQGFRPNRKPISTKNSLAHYASMVQSSSSLTVPRDLSRRMKCSRGRSRAINHLYRFRAVNDLPDEIMMKAIHILDLLLTHQDQTYCTSNVVHVGLNVLDFVYQYETRVSLFPKIQGAFNAMINTDEVEWHSLQIEIILTLSGGGNNGWMDAASCVQLMDAFLELMPKLIYVRKMCLYLMSLWLMDITSIRTPPPFRFASSLVMALCLLDGYDALDADNIFSVLGFSPRQMYGSFARIERLILEVGEPLSVPLDRSWLPTRFGDVAKRAFTWASRNGKT